MRVKNISLEVFYVVVCIARLNHVENIRKTRNIFFARTCRKINALFDGVYDVAFFISQRLNNNRDAVFLCDRGDYITKNRADVVESLTEAYVFGNSSCSAI